jgi:acyl-CoA reductase-like NAD-dependent aldehyde dehydrogenase
VRDAVQKARAAFGPWAARTAYNRGQILYRLAEVMESRRAELATSLARGGAPEAEREVDAAIDRTVYYAGFSDKFQSLVASSNPVAGPHFGFSVPEPMGVVGVVAPPRPALLGLVSAVLPPACGGNVVVALASAGDPRTALIFSECLATSDLPGGVVNLLSGKPSDVGPQLVRHRDVNAVGAWLEDEALRAKIQGDGAESVKRVYAAAPPEGEALFDDRLGQGLGWLERWLETKTVWHPAGI